MKEVKEEMPSGLRDNGAYCDLSCRRCGTTHTCKQRAHPYSYFILRTSVNFSTTDRLCGIPSQRLAGILNCPHNEGVVEGTYKLRDGAAARRITVRACPVAISW